MKIFIVIGSLMMALTVMVGAFGAHGLKNNFSIDSIKTFEKGVQYQAYHSLGLIIIGLLGFNFPHHLLWIPAMLFIFGIILFSGSLYVLVLSNMKWFGVLTPFGGISFVLGWIVLSWIIFRN
ncbi:MAG: DUF423 domain-containing protein [Candidatus Marinimicrobia bacterium]|nr:DUF423 domain-containing protein [Candidatus Neomarinimicrobiota bacterium]